MWGICSFFGNTCKPKQQHDNHLAQSSLISHTKYNTNLDNSQEFGLYIHAKVGNGNKICKILYTYIMMPRKT
jgi:hypothetical protein